MRREHLPTRGTIDPDVNTLYSIRIREGIAPYSRFIRSEGDKLKTIDQELREIAASLAGLREQIERPAAR